MEPSYVYNEAAFEAYVNSDEINWFDFQNAYGYQEYLQGQEDTAWEKVLHILDGDGAVTTNGTIVPFDAAWAFETERENGTFDALLQRIEELTQDGQPLELYGKTVNMGSFGMPDRFIAADFHFTTIRDVAFIHFMRNLMTEPSFEEISYLDIIRDADQYTRLPRWLSAFHRMDLEEHGITDNIDNSKWTSEDGLTEYIFRPGTDSFRIVDHTDPLNTGSYNFAPAISLDPSSWNQDHLKFDVWVWEALGNLWGDPSTIEMRQTGGAEEGLPDRITTIVTTADQIPYGFELNNEDNVVAFQEDVRFNLMGYGGNDLFFSGEQDDTFNGGDGTDTVSYAFSEGGISVNLRLGKGYDGYAAYDNHFETLISIENIIGSSYRDVIVGSDGDNLLDGRLGNDVLAGEGGNDELRGGIGNDYLEGGAGSDLLIGGAGTDTAAYEGWFAEYQVMARADGSHAVSFTGKNGTETDILVGVEKIQFDDFTFDLPAYVGGNVSLGPLVQANSHTPNNQFDGRTAQLANGDTVVVWTSDGQDGDGPGIYARLFAPDGSPVTGEIRVNDLTIDRQEAPSVTATADGGFAVTWQSWNADGALSGIVIRGFDADGTAGTPVVVNDTVTGRQDNPEVVTLADGKIVVVWDGNQDGLANVYGQIYAADGPKIGGEFLINSHTDDRQHLQSITATDDGGFFVSWMSEGQLGVVDTIPDPRAGVINIYGSGVYGQKYDASGAPVGGEILLYDFVGTSLIAHKVVQLQNGNIATLATNWDEDSDQYEVLFNVVAPDGSAVLTKRPLPDLAGADALDAQVLADGRIAITWEDEQARQVRCAVFQADGTRLSDVLTVSDGMAGWHGSPTIALLHGGNLQVSWGVYDLTGTAMNVATRTVSFDDAPLTLEQLINVKERVDTGDTRPWESIVETFDPTGTIMSKVVTYDDGRVYETFYAGGIRVHQVQTDPQDATGWERIEQFFEPDGTLFRHDAQFDDGREQVTLYENGLRTSRTVTDMYDIKAWANYSYTYDPTGKKTGYQALYDDGRTVQIAYQDGVKSSLVMTDAADAFNWVTVEQSFLSDGRSLERTTKTYDDGRVQVTEYLGGDKYSVTTEDLNDAFHWDTLEDIYYTDTFELSPTRVQRIQTYDDGREMVVDYLDGTPTQAVVTDVEDVVAWDHFTIDFDPLGNKISRTMVYDDGREVVTHYAEPDPLLG